MQHARTKLIVDFLSDYAAEDPVALTTITSHDRTQHLPWPNEAKVAQLHAEVLPDAMKLYRKHRPRSKRALRAAASRAAA